MELTKRIAGWKRNEKRIWAYGAKRLKGNTIPEHVYHFPNDIADCLGTAHVQNVIVQRKKDMELIGSIGGLQAHQTMRTDNLSPTLTQAMGMGGGQTPLIVYIATNTTNMQTQYTENTMENVTTETSEQYQPQTSQTTTYSLADSLARLSALLENEEDLTTPEGHSFLMSQGFSKTKDPDIWYSKTSKAYLVMTLAKLSRQSLGFSPTLGMECNGRYLILKTSAYPKTGSGCSLSDNEKILDKYLFFL